MYGRYAFVRVSQPGQQPVHAIEVEALGLAGSSVNGYTSALMIHK